MKTIILIIFLLFSASSFSNEVNDKLKITINIEEKKNSLELLLIFTNETEINQYIDEGGIGIIDFRNLQNRFVVLDENGNKLKYDGIKNHTSNFVHCIPPGKSIKVVHDISRVYNFENINGTISIYYKHQYIDKEYKSIVLKSNRIDYSGPPIKFRQRNFDG